MVWIVFIALIVGVIAVLLRPVLRPEPADAGADRNAYDRAVFRDQLAELERDIERGTIAKPEAEAARNEISRRLIGAAGPAPATRARGGRLAAAAAALMIPLVALPLYFKTGSPKLPDVPLAARLDSAIEAGDFEALIVRVETHLAQNPGDAEGWKVLAPAYKRVERWSDAANAYSNILRLTPPTAEGFTDLAEMLVYANDGMVSAAARRQFEEALKLDPQLPRARFFIGLALKQEGKREEAAAYFENFLAESPADAPWRLALEAQLQELGAQSADGGDQQAMIRGMVEGLEARLQENGDDLEGWLRLMRSRTVLNEIEKAKAAYLAARDRFKDNAGAMAQIEGLAKELDIQ